MNQTEMENLFQESRISEANYRSDPGVNKSTLWAMKKSPIHYKHILENPSPDTPSFKFGRAVHCAILQPDQFESQWIREPDVNRRTKEGKAEYEAFVIMAEEEGKEILPNQDYEEIRKITEAIRANPDAVRLLKDCITEKPLFWKDEETGIDCKCKADAMKPGIMIDLKTCTDASTINFTRDCFRFGYHVQVAHYINAYQTITGSEPEWYFIAIEKAEPYAINILKADKGFIDKGYIDRKELLQRLKDCRESGIWAGYGLNDLILPGYMAEG